MSSFVESSPTTDAYWRSIILLGQNSASYKFALGKSLLEVADQDKTFVSLEELAEPYSRNLIEHLGHTDRQGTSNSSRFLEACRGYLREEISKDQLVSLTERLGFANVLDAFHNVNQSELPVQFFSDERKTKKGITLTDDLLSLRENFQYENLEHEVEARWRLVETAWSMNLHPSLLVASYDELGDIIYIEDSRRGRRVDVTSCRDALNGYQQGRCFYCYREISLDSGSGSPCDVDHFFPHMLLQLPEFGNINLDGVWNLVLSCRDCNRGVEGKSALVPARRFLSRLHQRNEYLINSHHPLRETLISQTGKNATERANFLGQVDIAAVERLIFRWKPPDQGQPVM